MHGAEVKVITVSI